MARKYSRDSRGRFASGGGGGRSASGGTGKAAIGGASKGNAGKKKAVTQPMATTRKPPPPPPWSKAMLAAKARDDKASMARAAAVKKAPANAIKPSSLRAAEKAYGEIRAQKSKFRSDKKVKEEMIRRGFLKGSDPQGQLIAIGRRYRMRRGSPY